MTAAEIRPLHFCCDISATHQGKLITYLLISSLFTNWFSQCSWYSSKLFVYTYIFNWKYVYQSWCKIYHWTGHRYEKVETRTTLGVNNVNCWQTLELDSTLYCLTFNQWKFHLCMLGLLQVFYLLFCIAWIVRVRTLSTLLSEISQSLLFSAKVCPLLSILVLDVHIKAVSLLHLSQT